MKLPNFLQFEPFNRLKDGMGIPRDKLGALAGVDMNPGGVSTQEIKQLSKEGIDIRDIDEIRVLDDGTLAYKDRRILLHIRDIQSYGRTDTSPRFHFANCNTLQRMRAEKRFGRYVAANKMDGTFTLIYVDSKHKVERRLYVCQNCLDYIKYNGFDRTLPDTEKTKHVTNFSIDDFFDAFPKNLHHSYPRYTSTDAPINDYSPDFSTISSAYRRSVDWKCEACGIDLSYHNLRKYLHVHHINSLKYDNSENNLQALCLHCHANQSSHSHMRTSSHYSEFEGIWRKWRQE